VNQWNPSSPGKNQEFLTPRDLPVSGRISKCIAGAIPAALLRETLVILLFQASSCKRAVGFPMHELSVAQSILDSALRHAEERGFQRILSVHLKIGRLSGIEVESLRFCFEVLSAETMARSADLTVDLLPIRGKCRQCGREFNLEEVDFVCPGCHNRDIEVVSGTEMLMDKMEVE